jgi:Kef-type K+ transport system membrane component KefB
MTRRLIVYILVVAASVAAVAGLIRVGNARFPPGTAVEFSVPGGAVEALEGPEAGGVLTHMLGNAQLPLPRLLLQLAVIVLVARLFGLLARRLGQPPVIAEIGAGVMLGPSLLGSAAPPASAFLFPASSLPVLQLLSQIGVVLFMFVVGLELEPKHLRGKAQTAIAVSHFSIVVPFILGVALALGLYTRYAPAGVPFHAFALFCGIALSITAFPVLARILAERNLTNTPLGATAITCAAVDDVTAWSILAFVVAITAAGGAMQTLVAIVALSVVFVALMVFVGRPLLRRFVRAVQTDDALSKEHLALVLLVLLLSALYTELIGIHALFGAFVAGVVMPDQGTFRAALRTRLESVSSVFLLPIFFVVTGLRTHVGLLDDASSWAICLLIIAVATAGKLGGTVAAARWTGLAWRDALALGALMNTRGLMELVALNVGYDLGILTPEIFTMMVLMALVTTAMTGPLVSLSFNWGRQRAVAPAGPVARSS